MHFLSMMPKECWIPIVLVLFYTLVLFRFFVVSKKGFPAFTSQTIAGGVALSVLSLYVGYQIFWDEFDEIKLFIMLAIFLIAISFMVSNVVAFAINYYGRNRATTMVEQVEGTKILAGKNSRIEYTISRGDYLISMQMPIYRIGLPISTKESTVLLSVEHCEGRLGYEVVEKLEILSEDKE